ncbi:TetR family transcriptional regulator [Streptomyces violarus]|uniref:AcrR family transcriptional regulator n=1 Tax=Streptomyces violarus TaxID=67380 RepID=A0A7W5F065_9ACTN|nr:MULTISPECIES: TetR/AcrR family transcriptional regulator [Streptomyces]MBB3075109.1 AcrR family transcriptional regulator [Streptomyces violarus]WRT97744.1 TetR/AcrR family transcriptional regulator [Streptomyces sp. CGMCC 4.1772]GHD02248.1 TetR family transcriptional regulator [Streptomyces violarus]
MASEPARPLGRRERSKQRVRDRIYTSALTLFADQGYDGTTIDQIAEHADVARGTFFNYFQRKEDLVTAWAEARKRRLELAMEESMKSRNDDVTVHLERCMAALAEFNESEREITAAMLQAWVKAGQPLLEEPYAGQVFANIIEAGRQRGEVSFDIDPMRVGNILRDSYLGLLYRWSQDPGGRVPLHIELREVLRIVLTGVLSYSQHGRGVPASPTPASSPAATPLAPTSRA